MGSETDVNKEILEKYLLLMEDIKRRKSLITQSLESSISITDIEFSYLQLRKILEIIVKAPLLINENEYRKYSSRAEKDWHLATIMKYLSKANPRYYPEPYIVTSGEDGMDNFVARPLPYLSKTKLKAAYKRCNGFLHSTNPLDNPGQVKLKEEYEFIVKTLNESTLLLQTHVVHPVKSGYFYRVGMKHIKSGKATGQIFELVVNSNT
ncbi:hypothetical protein [Vibrio rotiferianus]|uniref:hypothetical protein n=1 Tax=Vibrio rotiferianus TaxID=190895 RepID=UPI0005770AAC|nr:hypothetical protein [Vibrio rotiferianus]PIB15133.1 hypothetical protein B853_15425 [Vibrio rotiferianus CAIM 577 = LMG 21460]